MEDTLETLNEKPVAVPQAVKTLAILAYIGNGLWAVVFLGVFFWMMAASSEFERLLGVGSLPIGVVGIAIFLVVAMCTLGIIGAFQMAAGKKLGFWLYLVGNGIWVLMNLGSGQGENIGMAVISIGFIVGFGANLKSLK
ncbi:MAG: hypothetical protein HYZ14_06415 [Bacteroidetes bacterium]|nr:hypothetical protein [Bacteroidota bacterium]